MNVSKLKKFARVTLNELTRQKEPVHISGDREVTVYVYDPKPLKGIKRGKRFVVQVSKREHKMKSLTTGEIHSSRQTGMVPIEYDGEPFGMISDGFADLKWEAQHRRRVTFDAMIVGSFARGIPEVKLMLPPYKETQRIIESL